MYKDEHFINDISFKSHTKNYCLGEIVYPDNVYYNGYSIVSNIFFLNYIYNKGKIEKDKYDEFMNLFKKNFSFKIIDIKKNSYYVLEFCNNDSTDDEIAYLKNKKVFATDDNLKTFGEIIKMSK